MASFLKISGQGEWSTKSHNDTCVWKVHHVNGSIQEVQVFF